MVSIWQTDIACIHIILRRGWVNRFEALTGDIMTCVTKYCFDSDQMVYASLFEKCYDGFDKGKWIKWINWETVWLTNPTVMMSYNLHGIWCGCVCVRCVLKLPLAWTQNANSNTNICTIKYRRHFYLETLICGWCYVREVIRCNTSFNRKLLPICYEISNDSINLTTPGFFLCGSLCFCLTWNTGFLLSMLWVILLRVICLNVKHVMLTIYN